MRIYELIEKLNEKYPFDLQEEWDNSGLQIGNPNNQLSGVVVSLDLEEESVDKAIEQSKDYGHTLIRELCFLSIHGLLHLLGYDHIEKEEEKIMFEKQELILNGKRFTNIQEK